MFYHTELEYTIIRSKNQLGAFTLINAAQATALTRANDYKRWVDHRRQESSLEYRTEVVENQIQQAASEGDVLVHSFIPREDNELVDTLISLGYTVRADVWKEFYVITWSR